MRTLYCDHPGCGIKIEAAGAAGRGMVLPRLAGILLASPTPAAHAWARTRGDWVLAGSAPVAGGILDAVAAAAQAVKKSSPEVVPLPDVAAVG